MAALFGVVKTSKFLIFRALTPISYQFLKFMLRIIKKGKIDQNKRSPAIPSDKHTFLCPQSSRHLHEMMKPLDEEAWPSRL